MSRLDLPQVQWHRISPRYITVELVSNLVWFVIWTVVTIVLWQAAGDWWWLTTVWIAASLLVQTFLVVPRNRAFRYAVRQDDLLVRRGVLIEQVVAVPYGRMQTVSMQRGPVARMLGLANLHMSTASVDSDARIPGLLVADAEQLRDHLIRVAETRRAGL